MQDHPLDAQFRFVHRAARGSRMVAALVEAALTGLTGVIKASANAKTGEVFVVFEPGRISTTTILQTLDEVLDDKLIAACLERQGSYSSREG